MNTDLIKYYKDRANEYEKIYSKPERQEELIRSAKILRDLFKDKNVFEVACGTGYWTEKIAETATSILATDINESVLEIAKQKKYTKAKVAFEVADIYNYSSSIKYENIFAGFIWSHVRKQDNTSFLRSLANQIATNGSIVLMDNNYVEGSNHPITKTDEFGNTYQTRKLEDGSDHLVLKNFPTESYLKKIFEDFAEEIKFIDLKYYWIAIIKTKALK